MNTITNEGAQSAKCKVRVGRGQKKLLSFVPVWHPGSGVVRCVCVRVRACVVVPALFSRLSAEIKGVQVQSACGVGREKSTTAHHIQSGKYLFACAESQESKNSKSACVACVYVCVCVLRLTSLPQNC